MSRIVTAAPLALLALLAAGCAAQPSADAAAPVGDAVPECPDATVSVENAAELGDALAAARPGDVIELSAGTYDGEFEAATAGTSDEPIFLCGPDDAVLRGTSTDDGYVLHLDGADHWRLVGFALERGQKGLMIDATNGAVIADLTVRKTGDEAIHLRASSSDNVVIGNRVSDTGHRKPKFGEGIYVGTAESNWCDYTDCEPDRSDRNRILGNDISGTTAEAVDIKEGTSGGVVSGNRFDGADTSDADSWVDVKGNDWVIEANAGSNSPGEGIQIHNVVDGWGDGNHVEGNLECDRETARTDLTEVGCSP